MGILFKIAFLKYARFNSSVFNLIFILAQVLFLSYLAGHGLANGNHIAFFLAFVLTGLGFRDLFFEDWNDQTLFHHMVNPHISLTIYILAELLMFGICILIPFVSIICVSAFVGGKNLEDFYKILWAACFLILGSIPIGGICSALCLAIGRSSFLPFILSAPFNLPIFLSTFYVLTTPETLSLSGGYTPLFLSLGLILVNWTLALIVCPFTLRQAVR